MTPIQPEELSALLDGELDPGRAREVEGQIAADPILYAEFEALSVADAAWRAAAASATFAPQVRLRVSPVGWLVGFATVIGGLVVLRIIFKLTGSDAFAFSLPAISLALLLAAIMWLADAERASGVESPIRVQEQTS